MILTYLKNEPHKYKELRFLHEYEISTLRPIVNSAIGRRLVSNGLKAAIQNKDLNSITQLVFFIKENQILAHISPMNVKFLIMGQEYTIILTLLHNNLQVRLPLSVLKKHKTLKKVMT